MKKLIICLLAFLLTFSGCSSPRDNSGKIKIVATIFPAYDFARAVAGDCAEVSMLLKPGTEIHSFEPTAEDIIAVSEADIFIYTGGDGDAWVEKLLDSIDTESKTIIKMTDHSELLYQEHSHEEEHHVCGADEHVWLSPDNAKSIIAAVCAALCKLDPQNAEGYNARAGEYSKGITRLAEETKQVVAAADTNVLVVADRFPLRYFCHYFSLEAEAAFDACDHFADADAGTVLRLINTVKDNALSHVFYLENGSGYLADTVCSETGAEKLIIHSMHTVSRDDFLRGITYTDIMQQNKNSLERGLSKCR